MPEKRRINLYLASLRLERWPRSLAIFPGLVMAYLLRPDRGALSLNIHWLLKVFVAFCLTWAISTVNYIINEITDAPHDAHHPTKMHRPLVKKEISRFRLVLVGLLLVIVSAILAFLFFSPRFFTALAALLLAGILYNVKPIRLKDIPYIDSTLESANNPIRFLIGWYVLSNIFPPFSLVVSWWAFGNFLMVGKRVAEKKFLTSEQSAAYRLSLKKYSLKGLITFMVFNALVFFITFILFSWQFRFRILFYMLVLPLILIYLVIFIYKSIRDRETAEEPEKLLRNIYFAIYTFFVVIVFILAFVLR